MDRTAIIAQFTRAEACRRAGQLDQAEAIYLSLIPGLPPDAWGRRQQVSAFEHLIDLQHITRGFPAALRVFRDYLASECAPACDADFDNLYCEALQATQTAPVPLQRRERFYALANLFRSLPRMEGLVAECGCLRGLSSFILCSSMAIADKGFRGGYRIFDSFQGLSEPQPEDFVSDAHPDAPVLKGSTRAGWFAVGLAEVRAGLERFPGIEFFPGWIPHAFPDEPGARYRFVHIDVDLYQPTRDSLEYFYPRLTPGGMIVCDDYNWPGARKAIEEYCAREKIKFALTPNQQAYFTRRA